MKTIELITPCFNEESCVESFVKEVNRVFEESLSDYNYMITYVDDGSSDNTLQKIKDIETVYGKERIHYISLSRNFGKESAIYAGLSNCMGDYVVIVDVDLQHPITLIPEMLQAVEQEGYDCATARRVSRKGEPKIRSAFSNMFYHVFNRITGMKLVPGGTDYRLMRKDVARSIALMTERERFTKGMYSWVGYKNKWLEYKNVERLEGTSKWSFWGLMRYALTGFTAFATTPLRGVVYLGMLTVIGSVIWAISLLIQVLKNGTDGSGFLSIVLLILFMSGVIITILGMIGEYLAKIYIEVKNRPIYIAKESNFIGEEW